MPTFEIGLLLLASLLGPGGPSSTTPRSGETTKAATRPVEETPGEKPKSGAAAKGEKPKNARGYAIKPATLERLECAAGIDARMKEHKDALDATDRELEDLDAEIVALTKTRDEAVAALKLLDRKIAATVAIAIETKIEGATAKQAKPGKDEPAPPAAEAPKTETQVGELASLQRQRPELVVRRDAAQRALDAATKRKNELEKERPDQEAKRDARYLELRDEGPKKRWEIERCARGLSNDQIEAAIERETRSFRGFMKHARAARCKTAVCWGPSNKYAFELLAELPIGKNFSFSRSGLGRYINGNEIQVSFNAGLRFWAAWDWVSVAVYLSKPILNAAEVVTVHGSAHEFPASQVRRPYPGLAVGLFGDLLWLSADIDQLRNGNSGDLRAPEFRPNDVISRTVTFTVAIAPVAGIRNGLGALNEKRERDEEAKSSKAAEEAAKEEKRREEQAKARGEASATANPTALKLEPVERAPAPEAGATEGGEAPAAPTEAGATPG